MSNSRSDSYSRGKCELERSSHGTDFECALRERRWPRQERGMGEGGCVEWFA